MEGRDGKGWRKAMATDVWDIGLASGVFIRDCGDAGFEGSVGR
jgi:hypothetical protein